VILSNQDWNEKDLIYGHFGGRFLLTLLLPPQRHPVLEQPTERQPIRLVTGEDPAYQVGSKEGEIKIAADQGGVQVDGLCEFGDGVEPALLEEAQPAMSAGYCHGQGFLDGGCFLGVAVG